MPTDHPIPDDLLYTLALAMSDEWNATMATGPKDATVPEEWDDAAQAALEALTAYADGALVDPNGWRRLDAQELAAYCPVHGGIGAWDDGIYECDKADDERACTVTPLHTIVERAEQ